MDTTSSCGFDQGDDFDTVDLKQIDDSAVAISALPRRGYEINNGDDDYDSAGDGDEYYDDDSSYDYDAVVGTTVLARTTTRMVSYYMCDIVSVSEKAVVVKWQVHMTEATIPRKQAYFQSIDLKRSRKSVERNLDFIVGRPSSALVNATTNIMIISLLISFRRRKRGQRKSPGAFQ